MSTTVLVIAGLHAIPPIAGAWLTRGNGGLIIGAVTALAISVLTGDLNYVISDLVGVGVGCFVGWCLVQPDSERPKPQKTNPKQAISNVQKTDGASNNGLYFALIAAGIVIPLLASNSGNGHSSPSYAGPNSTTSNPQNSHSTTYTLVETDQTKQRKSGKEQNHSARTSTKSDLRHCLALTSNDAIARCVER